MFRITQYMQQLLDPTPPAPARKPAGPVVIWNLIRRCNLTCKHCYSISADVDFPGELSTEEVFTVMDDLKRFKVPVLILSGGEPLLRADIFEISKRAKAMGFYVGLSSNGTLIDEQMIDRVATIGYDYVGISIDGLRDTHDRFRRRVGAFDESMRAVRLCRERGIKVGLRFTLTQDNATELPALLELMRNEHIDKFYLSHLNYAGRGGRNRGSDVVHRITREAMDLLFQTCLDELRAGVRREYVTGNNDADGVYLLRWAQRRFPERINALRQSLQSWGGNSSGVNIANIDNVGNVHPDTFWWNYNLGNIKDRSFSEIWGDTGDPLMAGLKSKPRPLKGRCRVCTERAICGGNTRVRAYQTSGDPWAEDPACYLDNAELGIDEHFVSEPNEPWLPPEPVRFRPRREREHRGEVWLVGAGPGDPGLLTLRAVELMERADVVLYDRLVTPAVLERVPAATKRVYVGKAENKHELSQDDINQLLIRYARQGKNVLRLKGGDPFIFGRGGEELEALSAAGIRYQTVPGVTAASGCASYAGIPLTHRDYAHSCVFITGHSRGDNDSTDTLALDWDALARPYQTLVFYMGLHQLDTLCAMLIEHGLTSSTPAALVEQGTTEQQRVYVGDLATLPALGRRAKTPTLVIVGEVVKLRDRLAWFEPQALKDEQVAAG